MSIGVTGGAGFIDSKFIACMMDTHPDYRICRYLQNREWQEVLCTIT